MKTIISVCAVLAAVVAFPETTYKSYDNYDVKRMIENPRTLKNYGKCFLDQGPCSPDGLEFKNAIPEALRTVCDKCTPKERELVRIVVHAFKNKQPEMWNELVRKLDPSGEYTRAFESFFKNNY